MAGRITNLALFGLLGAAFASGFLTYAIGTGWNSWATIAHAVTGIAIVVLAPWKQLIVRRGLGRRREGYRLSIVLYILIAISLLSGFSHSSGLATSFGFLTAMQVHVGSALVALPLALIHVVQRPARLHRTDLGRRQMLRAGAVVGGAAAIYAATEASFRLASLPGRSRRFTGSYERGSSDPDGMPVTQWLNDKVPTLNPGEWFLTVETSNGVREWGYEELVEFDDRVRATLDCTGGWYATQEWEGVRLDRLLDSLDAARSISVSSVTGYGRRLPIGEATQLLLATRVGGQPLDPGHGWPLRLVAPGRRGFWWVKWIDRVALSDVPWWTQSPFPLT